MTYLPSDSLENEGQRLETQVYQLNEGASPTSGRVRQLLRDISGVLEGYEAGVICARSIVECCVDNYRIGVKTLTLI